MNERSGKWDKKKIGIPIQGGKTEDFSKLR